MLIILCILEDLDESSVLSTCGSEADALVGA